MWALVGGLSSGTRRKTRAMRLLLLLVVVAVLLPLAIGAVAVFLG
jgi:hypothetical protein